MPQIWWMISPKTKIYEELEDDKIVIFLDDAKLALHPDIELKIVTGGLPLHITVNDITVVISLRIELSSLVPIWPCFGRIGISATESPYIDFQVSPGQGNTVDVMSIPGIAGWIRDTIDGLVDWYIYAQNDIKSDFTLLFLTM